MGKPSNTRTTVQSEDVTRETTDYRKNACPTKVGLSLIKYPEQSSGLWEMYGREKRQEDRLVQ